MIDTQQVGNGMQYTLLQTVYQPTRILISKTQRFRYHLQLGSVVVSVECYFSQKLVDCFLDQRVILKKHRQKVSPAIENQFRRVIAHQSQLLLISIISYYYSAKLIIVLNQSKS